MPKSERSASELELSALKRSISQLTKEAPELQGAFGNFLGAVLSEGALSVKTKELIALGIAVSKACKSCTVLHASKGLEAGLTREEMIEAGYVAILMGGGPAFTTMQHLLQALDDLEA